MLRALCVFMMIPVAALAHAHLLASSPAAGSGLKQAPETLTLRFSEAVESSLTNVAVSGPAGGHVEEGAVTADTQDARKVHVRLGQLAPGTYTVVWHAVSVDTHETQGQFSFTVTSR